MLRISMILVLLLLPTIAHAQKRVALVIGNSAYKHTGDLANPKNDATDMAVALKTRRFQVIEGYDLDKASLDQKVRDFAAALSGAEAGVFFYAGHGIQVDGKNYLVPTDAELATPEAVEFEMVQLDVIHRIMERQTTTNILFLDACRTNPLARNLARAMGTRSTAIARGLAPVESGVGTLISFSTQPGNVATDGRGRNSPFAGALAKRFSTSNDDLSAILIDVRNDVRKQTENKQIPWEHSALTGRFYFNQPPQNSGPALPPSQQLSDATSEWSRVDKTSIPELQTFLRRHASSPEADYARARLANLTTSPVAKTPVPQARTQEMPGGSFDGTWQFTAYDHHGCTDPSNATLSLTISNDAISGGGDRPATGRVDKAGKITFSRPARIVKGATQHYVGQLNGNSGSGRFTGAGRCAGRFSARRQ